MPIRNNFKLNIAFALLLLATLPKMLVAEEAIPPLTVVAVKGNHPFSFALPNGKPAGLYVEFWKLWSKTNNTPIVIALESLEDGLEIVKKNKAIHAGIFSNDQRRQWGEFSVPIHSVNTGIIFNEHYPKNLQLRDIKDSLIAVQQGSYQEKYLREHYSFLKLVLFDGLDKAVQQLLRNEVQAIVSEIPNIEAQVAKAGLNGVFTISDQVLHADLVFGLIAKGQTKLLESINNGIENIPRDKIVALEKKWLPNRKPFFDISQTLATLTLAEIKWLHQHPTILVGTDAAWPPYEYIGENGESLGISSDYLDYVNKLTGLTFQHKANNNWINILNDFKTNKVDIISAVAITPERKNSMLFTDPYFSTRTVIAIRKNSFFTAQMSDLKGKVLGLIKSHPMTEFVRNDYPEITVVPVLSVAEGLKKLTSQDIDAFINTATVINQEIERRGYNDLMIAAVSPYKIEIAMAVREELKVLVPILNKVFASLTMKQKSTIANTWFTVTVETGTGLKTILFWSVPIISFLLIIIFSIVYINRRLKNEILTRKQAEIERRSLELQLHQSQKMEALGKLTSGIAHDFNNMLSVIVGYSELLKSSSFDQIQLQIYADHILTAGQRGAKLTSKLMSFTRKQDTDHSVIDINDLLLDQQDLIQKTLTVRIKLDLVLDQDVWPIWLDQSDLEDAILNISINAMHSMAENVSNAQLIIRTNNYRVNSRKAKHLGLIEGEYIRLQLIDSGCGMSEEIRDSIFDPFFTTKGNAGSGLGLSQVFGFVKRSKGMIKVKSIVGIGSTFSMYFPRNLSMHEDSQVEISNGSFNFGGSESILIVDDEETLRDLAERLLLEHGYQVMTAASGQQALEILKTKQVDLLLSDVIMPEMDGYQLTSKVQEQYPKIKIQLISGYADKQNEHLVKPVVLKHLIHKPYRAVVLLKAIRELLDTE